jgi:Ca-activated chloride channel homolog
MSGCCGRPLEQIESRGATSLYDAVMATSDHLMKDATLDRKVILVVTDGEDTASYFSLEQAVRAISVEGGPTVYAIGILGNEKEKKARHALRELAEHTGGVAYFPADVSQVDAISREIAHELRNQYTIAYRPSGAATAGGYRRLEVKAAARGFSGLSVRTRSGYFVPGAETASFAQ